MPRVRRAAPGPATTTQPLLIDEPVYPRRPAFFALQFLRLLDRAAIAADVGLQGFALLTLIALTEDRKRYCAAPRWWVESIGDRLGLQRKAAARVIARCVKAGWLVWHQPYRRCIAHCWVVIPPQYSLEQDSLDQPEAVMGQNDPIHDPIHDPIQDPIHDPSSVLVLRPTPPPPEIVTPGGEEEELIARLVQCGVWDGAKVVHRALRLGATLAQIGLHVDHFLRSPGAWGAGALHRVLTTPGRVTGAPGSATWPPPAAGWQASRAAAGATQEAERVRSQAAAAGALSLQRKATLHQLELDFGPQVDKASTCELIELLTRHAPAAVVGLRNFGKNNPAVRPLLLRAFAQAAGAN